MKIKDFMATSLLLSALGCGVTEQNSCSLESKIEVESYTLEQKETTYRELSAIYDTLSQRVIRPAEGYLKYPYLIPAGFYSQMWDWDGFFMGNYFCSKGKPEYLKYWALNLIEGIDENGYVSGCATTQGPRPIFGDFSMKPFLAQGVMLASKSSGDYNWIADKYDDLKLTVSYREKSQRDEKTKLYFWQNGMQSGADNNVALNYFMEDTRSFLACDASTLQLREYKAMAIIAKKLGHAEDVEFFEKSASELREAINRYFWCDEDKMYYNIDRETGAHYKRVSYSSFWPLFDKLATEENGKAMIERYLVNSDHMRSKYGLRTLSLQDPDYNNKNMITPFSNWQGPVWPIANYIYSICLKQYGFDKHVEWVAMRLGEQIIADYKKYGSLHESFSAEDGSPLAPDDTHVDENGKFIGFVSWNLCIENIFQGIVDSNWNLLEIKE